MSPVGKFGAVVLVGIFILSSAPVVFASASQAASYNPGLASRYHSPISSMGLIALSHAFYSNKSSGKPSGSTILTPGSQTIPSGLVRFTNDSSYMPQSETSLAVDPDNPSHVVGGYNDGRYFLCPALRTQDCPSGYTASVSGFSVSDNGGSSVLKSDDLPSILATEKNLSSGISAPSLLVSWGDPYVVAAPDGTFYYSSLAVDPVTGANGVMLAKSNQNLFDPSVACITPLSDPSTNPCWSATLIYGNLTYQCSGPGACTTATLEDKDTSAVDMNPGSAYYGYVYTAWDHFNSDGTTTSYVERCSPSLACVMISGGSASPVSGADKYPSFTTPVVGAGGEVSVSWCNFGTATTLGPIFCEVRSSSAGGESFGTAHTIMSFMGAGTMLAGDSAIQGFATEQFRAASVLTFAADTSGRTNSLYFAIAVCTSGTFYVFQNRATLPSDNPGNCGQSAIYFSRSLDGGATWSPPADVSSPAVVIQPSLAVDPKNGTVVLAYYSTQFDPFNHRIDVMAAVSYDEGGNFSTTRVTPVSNEPNADPSLFDYTTLTGGSLVVPQYGDYFQDAALGGKVWVLFTGNYAAEEGTYQTDPFLATFNEVPAAVSLTPAAQVVTPGESVPFSASGFSPGTAYNLTLNWNGVTVTLAKGTVLQSGRIVGNFTVPSIESQVYTVLAQDSRGTHATATLGVGQVSVSGLQGAIETLRSDVQSLSTSVQSLSSSIGSMQSNIVSSINSLFIGTNASIGAIQGSVSQSFSSLSSHVDSLSSTSRLLISIGLVLLFVVVVLQLFLLRRKPPQATTAIPTT